MTTDPAVNNSAMPAEQFEYLEMPRDGWAVSETFQEKFARKTKENPLVPLGLLVTMGALSYGLWTLKTGDRIMSQKMMRLRIGAQGFTVFALLGGILYQANKKPVKN